MRHDPTLVRPPEVIDLPRLRLRRPRPSDAGAIFEFASDREAARYADWPVSTDISSVMQLLRGRDQAWNDGSEFYWVITLPAEEKVIGAIACSVSGHVAEFGYLLNRSFWFNGYATEAARAVVQWASSLPEVWRVAATCDIDNVASARVLEKVGLTLEAVLRRAIVRPNISSEPRDALLYAKVRE
jgi:ribosomal-protein-alanine N-acetyltransferase